MIQDRLNTVANAGLLVDGEFAPLTSRAITAFQRQSRTDRRRRSRIPHLGGAVLRSQPHPPRNRRPVGAAAGQPNQTPIVIRVLPILARGKGDGPSESWPTHAGYEPEPSITGQQLQQLRGWSVTGQVSEREWTVSRGLWRPRTGTVTGGAADRPGAGGRSLQKDPKRYRTRVDGPIRNGGNRPGSHGAHAVRPHPGGIRRHVPGAMGGWRRLARTGRVVLRHQEPGRRNRLERSGRWRPQLCTTTVALPPSH